MSSPKKPATIMDVARQAGVSLGSASRVLNNAADVTPEVRARTLAAAKALNYSRLRRRGSRSAGKLAGRGQTVGFVCFGLEDILVQLPSVSAAIHAAEAAISEAGGMFMFTSVPRGDKVPAFLAESQVAGVLLKGPNQGALPSVEENELLTAMYRVPHVWMMGRPPNALGDHVNFDARRVGILGAQYAFDRGHRRLAFFNPKPGHTQFDPIMRGFCERARDLGCEIETFESEPTPLRVWPLSGTPSPEKLERLTAEWKSRAKSKRATCIMVGGDNVAVQLYGCLSRSGAEVGRDVGLISCNNDASLIAGLRPALTTVDVNAEAIGKHAAARLQWRISHGADAPYVRTLVDPKLIERDSVSAL